MSDPCAGAFGASEAGGHPVNARQKPRKSGLPAASRLVSLRLSRSPRKSLPAEHDAPTIAPPQQERRAWSYHPPGPRSFAGHASRRGTFLMELPRPSSFLLAGGGAWPRRASSNAKTINVIARLSCAPRATAGKPTAAPSAAQPSGSVAKPTPPLATAAPSRVAAGPLCASSVGGTAKSK